MKIAPGITPTMKSIVVNWVLHVNHFDQSCIVSNGYPSCLFYNSSMIYYKYEKCNNMVNPKLMPKSYFLQLSTLNHSKSRPSYHRNNSGFLDTTHQNMNNSCIITGMSSSRKYFHTHVYIIADLQMAVHHDSTKLKDQQMIPLQDILSLYIVNSI